MARGITNKKEYQILKMLTNPINRKTMIIEDHNHILISDNITTKNMERIL